MDTIQNVGHEMEMTQTEGARRATGVCVISGDSVSGVTGSGAPNPEVRDRPLARRLTVEYKLRILTEVDNCKTSSEIGALLRREGIYSSYICRWRRQREQGILEALIASKRGRKPDPNSEFKQKISELELENELLKKRLKQAETIIDVQKKVSEMLGINMEPR